MKKPLPIGVENFEQLINNNYFFADKTLLIKEIIDSKSVVNLFTRPRRFGKTLNLSMLRCFFEDTGDARENNLRKQLFSGLKIDSVEDAYKDKMCSYPVIKLSLKSSKQPDFQDSYLSMIDEIGQEFYRHKNILESDTLLLEEKEKFRNIMVQKAARIDYAKSLQFLSHCLKQASGSKVVILIDEYDVPLENAYFGGFYDEMVSFIRSLFESALKTNDNMEFAVITGCLRISKESIFTGLNNLEINSIQSKQYGEYFGFLQSEVEDMLVYYQQESAKPVIREWYDGYLFGTENVYNPWSVINYVKELEAYPKALPRPYWAQTSSNQIIKTLLQESTSVRKANLESLVNGEIIEKPVHEDITYEDIYNNDDNLWNFLYFTGYLKKISERLEKDTVYLKLAIPNTEVKYIYNNTIMTWLNEKLANTNFEKLYRSMLDGNVEEMGEMISDALMSTISYYDSGTEGFYHGFMAGILQNMNNYYLESNREAGNGRPDMVVRYNSLRGTAIIMEFKYSRHFQDMDRDASEAVAQIERKRYDERLKQEGYKNIKKYGLTFYRKDCFAKK